MRSHITRIMLAAAAAGVTATTLACSAAGAARAASTLPSTSTPRVSLPSGGTPVYTPGCPAQTMLFASPAAGACAGYQATGRDFRFAKAVITMPTGPCGLSSPERYISLAGADSYARAGIWCSIPLGPPGPNHAASVAGRPADGATVGTYEGFFVTWQQGSVPVVHGVSLTSVSPGDGVVFSIYFTEAGDSDQFTASGSGVSASLSIDANGPVYTTAQALTDWSYSLPTTPAPASQTGRVTQFLQGRFTTASGQRGTFAGPWTLTPVEATSNGLAPPQGTLRSAPGALWTDGSSLYGLPGDAFGVWLYS